MTLHPEVQDKAQNEIDALLGNNSLPTFEDRERLPYIECIIKEVLRWNPAAPLIGHSIHTDDIVDGYTIPAGSTVMANTWYDKSMISSSRIFFTEPDRSFTHDSTLYSHPDEFNPDRFLGPNEDSSPDPRLYVFGFGRR